MRISSLLIALLFALPLVAGAQTSAADSADSAQWRRFPLGVAGSIELPSSAKSSFINGLPLYSAYTTSTVYVAIASKVADENFPADATERDQFYDNVLKKFTEENPQARLVRRTPFEVAGQHGLDVQIDWPGEANFSRTKYERLLCCNGSYYFITWRQLAGHDATDDPADRAHLFNSLTVTGPVASSSAAPLDARAAGRQTGRLLFYVAVGAGLIFLLRRRFRSRA